MKEKEFRVILEDINSNFRAFKEGLDLLRETTNIRFGNLEKEIREFKEETRGMNKFLQDMMFEHEKFMAEHEKWLRDHEVKIGDHNLRIHSLEKKVA